MEEEGILTDQQKEINSIISTNFISYENIIQDNKEDISNNMDRYNRLLYMLVESKYENKKKIEDLIDLLEYNESIETLLDEINDEDNDEDNFNEDINKLRINTKKVKQLYDSVLEDIDKFLEK